MSNGYEKFFREAQKSAGLSQGKPLSKANQKKKKIQFPLRKDKNSNSTVRQASPSHDRHGTPEQRLRQELAERMSRNKKLVSKRRKKMPIAPVICTAIALVTCSAAYMKADVLDEWLSKVEVSALGQAMAEETAPPADPKVAKKSAKEEKSSPAVPDTKEKSAGTPPVQHQPEVTSTKGWTTEELSFFSKLNERKTELDLREAELGKLEEELQKRKAELDEKLKSLESMRAEISKALKTRVADDQQKVDKLVQVYSSMKPQQAAKVIESLNEDLAVEILDKMKKKSAAEILDMMNAKQARRLSELLTGYQRSPASEEAEDGGDSASSKPAVKAEK